ncbi:MAG: non-ribosomal peptide synthetase, partial [Marivirga sp.]|nr:non-ribosomal peptide synthetase [Marivirga sp.]
ENVAISVEGTELTYRQLDILTNKVANKILKIKQLVRSTKNVSTTVLLFNHSPSMIIGMFGTLKSGSAYVPLDPQYPVKRIVEIIQDSNAELLLTDPDNIELAKKVKAELSNAIDIVDIHETNGYPSIDPPGLTVGKDALCYILYTSGSTGKPKGVMQSHGNVLHFFRVYTNAIHISAKDKMTMLSNYCFDASVMSIYGALLNGATLYLYDVRNHDIDGLLSLIKYNNLTIYHSTPSLFRLFVNALEDKNECRTLRMIVLGGEAVLAEDVEKYRKSFADDCLLVNGLGPTESTVTMQYFIDKHTRVSKSYVPVGYPVSETSVRIMRNENQPADIFEYGEMHYQSNYLSLGYWNNEEGTAQAFFSSENGKRYYRSGDIGRMLPSGIIEFQGRKDLQVKIRGYRVELGEVEGRLMTFEEITNAIVIARRKGDDNYLIAYYVSTKEISSTILRSYLSGYLPAYMVPAYYVQIEEVPLTSNGKVNYRGLPDPGFSEGEDFEAPSGEIEQGLAEIWSEILGIKGNSISANSNFFEIGGHSLIAALLVNRISQKFKVQFRLKDIFIKQSIKAQAEFIELNSWLFNTEANRSDTVKITI